MEVLRLTTSGMNMRKATEDLTMQTHDNTQYKIRKGDMVFYYSQMLHFDRDIYPEPQVTKILNLLRILVFFKTTFEHLLRTMY